MNIKYLPIVITLLIISCEKDDNNEYNDETFLYSISTDKSTYSYQDTIHWNASLANLGDDTISFDDHGSGRFYNWKMIDAFGTNIDGIAIIDSVYVYRLMPGEVLEDTWTTLLDSFFYSYLNPGYHFGIMKPWYNSDWLNFDTTEFYVE